MNEVPTAGPDAGVRSTILPNGLRVVSERLPGARSVALGFWVRQGGAHETPERMGASHLLEHMVFKGTERRTQREIALSLESLGGHLDAYTSREHTSYQARVLDAHLDRAVDVLVDLTFHPLLRASDLETEREVVLEEIATVEDTPDDLVFELHGEALWGTHGYGHRILGTEETVGGMSAETLVQLHRDRYTASNTVLIAVGRVDHDELVERVAGATEAVEEGSPRPGIDSTLESPTGRRTRPRDTAQTHIVTGRTTVPHRDPRRYPLILLSQALGGGMSSRLFQRIREVEGLAYAVYSFQSFYGAGGTEGVYLGTRPEFAARASEAVREELERLGREGLPEEELARIREQVKGQTVLSLDSTSARLYRLAGYALRGEEVLTPDEVLRRIDAVGAEEARAVAAEFFDPDGWLELHLGPGG